MGKHGIRPACYILGEGVFREPDYLSGAGSGCPVAGIAPTDGIGYSALKFGRMFGIPPKQVTGPEGVELFNGLIQLGQAMNQPAPAVPDSDIPAGYTYLGQFIAHEITFDSRQDLPTVELNPENLRSPAIDLDSLYGPDPRDDFSKRFYEEGDPARLKVDSTGSLEGSGSIFANDLPRDEQTKEALIGDPRNDENLAVAQTLVAFIKFHNKVVERLREEGHNASDLFDCARTQVIRHFQWIILKDFLPRLVQADVLDCVIQHGPGWFNLERRDDLYMPLEFSAAAFRLGHSMVRGEYQWNKFHAKGDRGGLSGALLGELFDQTGFSCVGLLARNKRNLSADWVIDWRRFFQFPTYQIDPSRSNRAERIDTNFDFHLDRMTGFPADNLPANQKSITVRNLLRGFALGLPTGEEVAKVIGEKPLSPAEAASGPHQQLLSSPIFEGKTPLWYYILKEAELNGENRLGPVGSRIVAETLVGLIKNSRYSLLDAPNWQPRFTKRRDPKTNLPLFEMVDLLEFADVINPLSDP